ncbi:MAG: ABC transporter permease subunit/CPBP intramembrane protease [Gemmataceae bacterium]
MTPSRAIRFARKELRETLRDRRTILTLVLMPLLLYPLLGVVFRQFFLVNLNESAPEYRIGVGSEAEGELLVELLGIGDKPPPLPRPSSKLSALPQPTSEPVVKLFVAQDVPQAVNEGGIQLGIVIANPPSIHAPLAELRARLTVLLLDESPLGREALAYLRGRLAEANVRILQGRAKESGDPPLTIEPRVLTNPDHAGAFSLSTLVPLVLILMTITGAVYPAIDLTAGERERGTLEVLMAAPVPRVGLLAAKYLAVVAVSVLTGLVNLGMMALTLWLSGLGPALFGPGGLTIGTALSVLGLLVLFSALFSALLLALTSFARSFKEAQAYLIPLMLVALTPGLLALAPGLKMTTGKAVVPLLNVVLLARDVFDGQATLGLAAAVVASTLLYATAAVAIAARVFGAEAVLYGDGGQWSDLVRRPSHPRPAASASGALLTLALTFPLQFVLQSALLPLARDNRAIGLALSSVVGIVLFVGLPLLAAWIGRIELTSGLALRGAWWLTFPAGIVLGLALAPVSSELMQLQKLIGFTSLPDRVGELLGEGKAVPFALLLIVALTPAIVEEVFFRGFLFTALSTTTSGRSAVLATAALFALFHIGVGDLLAIERFLPTFLVGLVLGWIRLRSGSIWPAVVTHACHNAALTVAARAELLKGSVPLMWLALALVTGGAAILAIEVGSRGRRLT